MGVLAATSLAGTRVLITGVGGFLGSTLASVALAAGAAVHGAELPQRLDATRRILHSVQADGVQLWGGDATDAGAFATLLAATAPAFVVHAAGMLGRAGGTAPWSDCVRGNVLPLAALIEAASSLPAAARPAILSLGSQLEYGPAATARTETSPCRPVGAYAVSKLCGTRLLQGAVRSETVRGVTLRLPVVFGPCQSPTLLLPDAIRHGLRGVPFAVRTPAARRQFVSSRAVATQVFALLSLWQRGDELPDVLNLASGAPRTVRDILEALNRVLDIRLEWPSDADASPSAAHDTWLDDALARSLGLAAPADPTRELAAVVDWYRQNPWYWEGPPT